LLIWGGGDLYLFQEILYLFDCDKWNTHHYVFFLLQHCDIWAVSRKWIGKYIAMERLLLGNQLITKHSFQGYRNWKLETLRKTNRCLGINTRSPWQQNGGTVKTWWLLSRLPCRYKRQCIREFKEETRVEAGSNTSTVTLQVVGGDEKGSLKSETVKYGHEFHGTRTWERLHCRGPAAYIQDRSVLLSERAPQKNKTVTVNEQ
jgi:hypothetical protein